MAISVLHILRTIKERGSVSRTDLQQITGLSWGTVTNTTRELLGRNLIREEGVLSTKAGRKPMRLAVNTTSHSLLGVEIAPDRVQCMAMNLAGDTLWYEETPNEPGESPDAVLRRTADMVRRAMDSANVRSRERLGVGVAVPGAVALGEGLLRGAPRLPGWKDVPVRSTIEQHISVPVRMEHNPNCLALAERWFGAAGAAENVLCIHLGEGVGMGVLMMGEIYRGHDAMAGEFGHTTLDPAGPACACGDRGCVEAYCGASAVLAHAHRVASPGTAAANVRTIDALAELATQNDAAARQTFEYFGEKLGVGIANLIDVLNPEVVILAGRTVAGAPHFMGALEKQVAAHAWPPSSRRILVSRLGERATAMGACGMILQNTFGHDSGVEEGINGREIH